jgi:3-deoxy-7-phosphoheptulonate synthase
MEAAGRDFDELKRVEFYTSHEGLLMDYERPMTRIDSRNGHASQHLGALSLGSGERTRDLDGRTSTTSAGCATRSASSSSDDEPDGHAPPHRQARPRPRAGPAHVHHAHGRGKIRDALPAAARGDQAHRREPAVGHRPDARQRHHHAERLQDAPLRRRRRRGAGFFEAHRAAGTYPGGIHVELTGDDVTECLGGSEHIDEATLATRTSRCATRA